MFTPRWRSNVTWKRWTISPIVSEIDAPSFSLPRKILGQINWALFVEEGYHGNREDYYDPRNSYLNEVIDRKTGIPISLSVLYRAVAERLELNLEGANLPAHFMLRLGDQAQPLFIDVFNSGDLLDRKGCEHRLSELIGRPVALFGKPARSLSGPNGRGADASQSQGHHPCSGRLSDRASRSAAACGSRL